MIDESSESLEAQSWIPLLDVKKVILARDHWQLPPTVKSLERRKTGPLETILFDQIIALYGKTKMKMLTV
jgi:superfamily I DNA and/or RNA helicase